MPNYTVKPGDCFNSIAKDKGFFNYQTVYKNGQNAKTWPNPNMLEEGGTVDVPDKTIKKVAVKLDSETKFLLDRRKTRLRLVLVDANLKPLKLLTCVVTVGAVWNKMPNSKGLLELPDIDPTIKTGTLKVTLDLPAPTPAAPPPAPVPNPNAYPPQIVTAAFEDPVPTLDAAKNIGWVLNVGFLEQKTAIRGVLQRMVNLGFGCPVAKIEDDKTKLAISAYQLFFKLKKKGQETGAAADIRSDIAKRHDTL
jgi:hypothetical protein